jgi:hypothetical protein
LVVAPDVNWAQANTDAVKMGGWLVTIDSISEQEFVTNLLLTQKAPPGAYWFGLEKSPKTGTWVWSSKTQPDTFTHWLPQEPDNRGGNEAYGSILWDGPSASTYYRDRNGFWNDLPLNGYKAGAHDVTSDLVETGYIVEFVGKHKGAFPTVVQKVHAEARPAALTAASSLSPAVVSSIPLPSAALLFPLGVVMAIYAGRRMQNRPN